MARGRNSDHVGCQSKVRKLKCYYCHKEGHYRKDCPEHKRKKKDNSKTADAGVVDDNSDVLMGNNVAYKVVGIGSIQIRMHDGIVRTLTDVRHVPEVRKNLISLGTLDSNGCSYRAAGGVMRIVKGALVVMKELKQKSLFVAE
ncbi:hypothetical protein RJ639_044097 [Escallonia herrerae]|uniref:CCHC-type domain-containing protein n=1 Tax=Escallonia herrerae TaxID=1293975 RepID=A0AA88WNY3_9ASTE|nr:hypothetical protein RJ639_044097 [Escallonia herrerae]